MVNIVDDWESLEKYARQASADKLTGLYQLVENGGKAEIRVWIGNCGFKKEFKNPADDKLMAIRDFCWKEQYTQISRKHSRPAKNPKPPRIPKRLPSRTSR